MTRSRLATLVLWLAVLAGLWWAWHAPPVPRLVLRGDGKLNDPSWSRDGQFLAARCRDHDEWTLVWEADTGRFVSGPPHPEDKDIWCGPCYDFDKLWSVLTVSQLKPTPHVKQIWRPGKDKVWRACPLPPEAVADQATRLAFSPDGRRLTFQVPGGPPTLWSLEDNRQVCRWPVGDSS